MRTFLLAGSIAVAWLPMAGQAAAEVAVKTSVAVYAISGKSGSALIEAMDRHGPKHGFLTRAIAQTRYSVAWTIEWAETRSACRVKSVDGELAITYMYPRVSGALSPGLSRRWDRFIAGVKKHEQMHGTIARQMAKEAERSIAKLTIANDRGCRKSRDVVKSRMAKIYAEYEARQNRFDAREHRQGGQVDKLITALEQR